MSTEEQIIDSKGIQSISEFYEKNKKNVSIAGIALIVLAAGIWYYKSIYKPGLEEEANDSFFMAERYYDMDSLNLALNGDPANFMGMLELADEYSGTKIGDRASYYAGRILLQQGKYDDALDHLEDVSMDDEFMSAQVITLQGDCLSELEKYEDAGDQYMKAAKHRTNDLTTPYALLKAGIAYEEAKEYDDAYEAYELIFSDYNSSKQAQNIELRMARVKAKMTAQ
jgi:tetratricopeptide (TPR) repeat protein